MQQKFRITGIAEHPIDFGERGPDGYARTKRGYRLSVSPVNYYPPLFDHTGPLYLLTMDERRIGEEIEISVQ